MIQDDIKGKISHIQLSLINDVENPKQQVFNII